MANDALFEAYSAAIKVAALPTLFKLIRGIAEDEVQSWQALSADDRQDVAAVVVGKVAGRLLLIEFPDQDAMESYVRTVARSVAADLLKKRRVAEISLDPLDGTPLPVEDEHADPEDVLLSKMRFGHWVAAMTPDQLRVVLLRGAFAEADKWPHADIDALFGWTPGHAGQVCHAAKRLWQDL